MIRQMFLDGARIVVDAIGSPTVGAAWDAPSVLEGQSVGSLAGHVARGGVWLVEEFLDQELPATATFDSPDAYFALVADALDDAGHQGIRDRGAAVAAAGQAAVVEQAGRCLAALANRLPGEPEDRAMPVSRGSMLLDDYLATRIVEQVVHLDDLACSIGGATWRVPDEHVRLVLTIGTFIGLRRRGADAMLRALFRSGEPGVLPVL